MVNPDRNLYEPPYDDALLYESDLEPERPRSRPLVVLLGVVVLAAFAGVVWVAYNQGVKHGQVGAPVLSADSGPTRIPADGATAETKDVAADKSYDRLFGDASEQPETVLPPAEQPRTLAANDVPADGSTADVTDESAIGGPKANLATDLDPPGSDPRMDSNMGVPSAAFAPGSPQPISSAPPTPLASGSEDITDALPPVEAVKPSTGAPKIVGTPKPAAPQSIAAAKPPVVKPAPAPITPPPAAVVESVPAPAPAEPAAALATPSESRAVSSGGSVQIQLGSFPNDKLAASAWSKIKSANQGLLGDYKPTIKSAEIEGKGTWYRLRVGGFADKASAASVCEQLKATGQACIIASK